MTEPLPFIDIANLPTPEEGGLLATWHRRAGREPLDGQAVQLVDTTSIFLNLRVADIDVCYEEWKAKGAEFLTPPLDRGAEIRCYMRDPDEYLIEVGQATGLLQGKLATKRPEDLPG